MAHLGHDTIHPKMESYQILVVDDQRKTRDKIQSAVETLGSNFNVVAVPSGEEALLEIRTQVFHVMISNINLPGISGLELMPKVRIRDPGMKIILVTEEMRGKLGREIAGAGADAVYLMADDPADFLVTLERCLGLVESSNNILEHPDEDKTALSVSERLANLHQDLGSITSVLLDNLGRIQAQAGDFPETSLEESLIPSLMDVVSASSKVSRVLGSGLPSDLLYFSGSKYDIILAHVGDSFTLLEIFTPLDRNKNFGKATQMVYAGVADLHKILLEIGIKMEPMGQPLAEEIVEDGNDFDEEAPFLTELLEEMDLNVPAAEEVDAFWDSIIDGDTSDRIPNADVLTYDQARQLGLTPEEEEE